MTDPLPDILTDPIVAVARRHGRLHWFRSERELWVLDTGKWREAFVALGYDLPHFDAAFRSGLQVVDRHDADRFLEWMRPCELAPDALRRELLQRFPAAASWWDVGDLFPVLFVDFDRRAAAAFYAEGTPLERYLPDGWHGEFVDFANDWPEELFPAADKFWIVDGVDLLQELNRRGAAAG